jgi:uncharacterized membrane protein YtjA (UPF0391 family)
MGNYSVGLIVYRSPEFYDFWVRLSKGEHHMLYWALVFLIVAIVAAVFGFAGVATAAAGVAKLLFYIFLVVFAITLIMGLMRRGGTSV